jgi:AAA+ ATPase superfamily predicted ATPase
MLLNRGMEAAQLNQYYNRPGSGMVVVYGQKGIGKTSLIREFVQDKPHVYYLARSCSEREQIYRWGEELKAYYGVSGGCLSYEDIFYSIQHAGSGKRVLVIDEFQNILKTDSTFFPSLYQFLKNPSKEEFLVVLCSSSVCFVENNMIKKMGEAAHGLRGLLKLRKLRFTDLRQYFPAYDLKQCICLYALLDGLPGLWKHIDTTLSVKENVVRNMLDTDGFFLREAMSEVSEELRETAVYNTILTGLAEGRNTLQELYSHTGFSRAKISVYLKSLMELELVEKVFSFDTEGHANTKKGYYRIKSHLVDFYYRFVYPHASDVELLSGKAFYEKYIEKDFRAFVDVHFKEICREYMEGENTAGKLPFALTKIGEWIGKQGCVDIVGSTEGENCLIGACFFMPMVTYELYEELLLAAKQAKIAYSYIYLFGIDRFDGKLLLEARVKKNIRLVNLGE